MALFHYTVKENNIPVPTGEVGSIPADFHYYERTFGEGEIHYKMKDGKITEVICEIENGKVKSGIEVKEFLDNLLLG